MPRLHLNPWLWAVPAAAFLWLLIAKLSPSVNRWVVVGLGAALLLIFTWLLGRQLGLARSTLQSGRFVAVFLGYCMLFSSLAVIELPSWKRQLVGYEQQVPTNWLGLSWLGDWRYCLLPPTSSESKLLVLTLAPPESGLVSVVRWQLAAIIETAVTNNAIGVALDFYLESSSRDEIAPLLRDALCHAKEAGIPVYLGYGQNTVDGGEVVEGTLAPELVDCIPLENRGYLAGYAESDGRIRSVPLYFKRNHERPALSLLIAEKLAAGAVKRPSEELVRFTQPHNGLRARPNPPQDKELKLYDGAFVMVGTSSELDTQITPFGPLQGVEVHALAAYSLATGRFIERIDAGWQFPLIFFFCLLMIAFQTQVGGWKTPLLLAGLLSLEIVGVAAVAITAYYWIDIAYPIAAVWLLAVLLLVFDKKLRVVRAQPVTLATPAEGFDVMLCHNGADKAAVRALAEALTEHGLRPWLDEDELVPGRRWQEGLETALMTVPTAAILVGRDGLGPWERSEMRVCLNQAVKRNRPVIPVLLPGAPKEPKLPPFLEEYTWVDLREGLTGPGLDRLVWAITGKKPTPKPGSA